jgi:hypothetical protein
MGADIVVDPAEVSPYQSWYDAATPYVVLPGLGTEP